MSAPNDLTGPDLTVGFPLAELPDGELFAAHAMGKPLVVVRRGDRVDAIGATCTHYGGPLAQGLLVGDTVRCPWHHACFSLRTGEALAAPALRPVAVWTIEVRDGKAFALIEGEASDGAKPTHGHAPAALGVESIIIIGAGAAGSAAAEMLRREAYFGRITLVSADESAPYDRPNLSKDYLAGNAPEDWIPLRPDGFYAEHNIDLILRRRATRIELNDRKVMFDDGRKLPYDRLLLATGATPVRLKLPGSAMPHVHYLRTLADSRAIIAASANVKRVAVIGASFIGLEVAASLRARGLDVDVVGPESVPLEKVMGRDVGMFIQRLHEQRGVRFHLGASLASIGETSVTLSNGERVDADLVVIGVGVRPEVSLAEAAGIATDNGVVVNEYMETSVSGVFAAGDIARWPSASAGAPIRVEHWVVAQRQGQAAAKNMLGLRKPFTAAPFFWSAHYDTTISYVGHAAEWDEAVLDGDLGAGDATVTLKSRGKTLAVITVGRDLESLKAELAS